MRQKARVLSFFQSFLQKVPVSGTSGGIFAMRKDWFQQLGLFDEGMREWGGGLMKLRVQRYAMHGISKTYTFVGKCKQ